jgi:hypothetical protein
MPPNGPGGRSAEDDDPLPEDGVRRDLRVSKHEDLGVEVRRDLTSQGWLARGSNTRMSKLSFHMGAVPRDYKDPELQALSEPKAATSERTGDAVTPEPPAAAPAVSAQPPAAEARPNGVLRRIRRLFGGA